MRQVIFVLFIIASMIMIVISYQNGKQNEQQNPQATEDTGRYSAVEPATQNTALKRAKMEWLEARAAQTAAVVKYGDDRHSNSEYKAIQARATAAMSNLRLEKARAE